MPRSKSFVTMPQSGQKKDGAWQVVPGSSRAPAPATGASTSGDSGKASSAAGRVARNIADGAKAIQPKNTTPGCRTYVPCLPSLPFPPLPSFLPKLQGTHSAVRLVRRQGMGRRGHGLGAEALPAPEHRGDRPRIPGTGICGPPQEEAGWSPRLPGRAEKRRKGKGRA